MSTFTDYKVKDISLADRGRKEIQLAEAEMPGLMAIRAEYPNCCLDRDIGLTRCWSSPIKLQYLLYSRSCCCCDCGCGYTCLCMEGYDWRRIQSMYRSDSVFRIWSPSTQYDLGWWRRFDQSHLGSLSWVGEWGQGYFWRNDNRCS